MHSGPSPGQKNSEIEDLLSQSDSLSNEYKRYDEIEYIEDAIELDRQALSLCTPGHPLQVECLNFLSVDIWHRYRKLGGLENVNEAINIAREALSLCPERHPDRSRSLVHLALCLGSRYETLGGVADLSEAITLDREALALRLPGHPDRSISLNNLAGHLFIRYDREGVAEDLTEAIELDREALSFRPPGHQDRSASLNNLAIRLSTRYERQGAVDDLTEAIKLDKEALSLRPPGHPDRSNTLINLAADLSSRYKRQGAEEDLMEAIELDREALSFRPPGHPDRSASLNNLAISLSARYKGRGAVEDLTEAIDLSREVLSLCPQGHPRRSVLLKNLATHLKTRYKQVHSISFKPSNLTQSPSHLPIQLDVSEDKEEIFILYSELACNVLTASSHDLSAAKAWVKDAEMFHHSTTPLAYQTALRLLVLHVAALPSLLQHLSILKSLSSSLAVDAFSAHVRSTGKCRKPFKGAIELLEQGRAVFWNQLIRLRSPLEDVVASGPTGKALADEYTRLTLDIHQILNSSDRDQHDKIWRLNMDLERTVSVIRQLPGLSRFLLPPLYTHLRLAAIDGPVVIVNASHYSCDALILTIDAGPAHVPLSITKTGVEDLSSRLRVLTARAKLEDVTRDLTIFLRALWDQVVDPIYRVLERKYPCGSRVWWCPASDFSHLPLHTANPYRKNQNSFSDLYISSYTPSLSALVRARRQASSPSTSSQPKRFVAIGQANAVGTSQLHTVGAELANIGQRLSGLSTFSCVQGQDASISRTTEELNANEWVHLACHGIPKRKAPLESAFALHDGRLTVRRIAQANLRNAEFAFLSACHTLVGDEECPDEAIHLAGAMQFAGFRSVIGTLWAVDDAQALKVTSAFYKNMLECGRLDHTRAAEVLWKTVRTVKGVTLDQRILYVHLGV